MTAARTIAGIAAALVCGVAVWATPAWAEVIEFALGSEPEVDLLSYELGAHAQSFTVTARLDRSTPLWFQDVTSGRHFQTAVLTATAARTVLTMDLSDVLAVAVMENTGSDMPTITATFDYRTISEHFSTIPEPIPEPSIWAMMLLGSGGLAIGGYCASRRRWSCFA